MFSSGRYDFVKNFAVVVVVLLMFLLASCEKKPVEKTTRVPLSREEVLSLAGIEEEEIVFSKVEILLPGKPLLKVLAYNRDGREIFSQGFSQMELKGGYFTVALLKSPVINALRILYGVTDKNGTFEGYVQDLPYHEYQKVETTKAEYSSIASKGEFKLLSFTFGQDEQSVHLEVK